MTISRPMSVGIVLSHKLSSQEFIKASLEKSIWEFGFAFMSMEDNHCQTRPWKCQFCIGKASYCHNTRERHITATILFHTSSYDNSFKCQTYVCRKSVGESIREAKGRKYAKYHKFLRVRWCCFFNAWFSSSIHVIIAPAISQDSTPYWLC